MRNRFKAEGGEYGVQQGQGGYSDYPVQDGYTSYPQNPQAYVPQQGVPFQNPGAVPPQPYPYPEAYGQPLQNAQFWQQNGMAQGNMPPDANGMVYPPQFDPQAAYRQAVYQTYMQQPPPAPTPVAAADGSGKRHKKKKNKKQLSIPLWKLLLPLAVLAVAGIWVLVGKFMGNTQLSAVIEQGSLGETYSGDALIVRNETAYDEEGVQNVDYIAKEGSVVYRGDVICYVYSTGYSTKEMTALQDFRDQITDYEQTLLKSETAYDQKMTRLENEVIERGLEVRSLVQGARGNMINQENLLEQTISERQNYFKSKYSTDMRLNRLFDDENTQQQRIDSWIKQQVATQESIVSFYTDGFEFALTPSMYETYSPQQVRSMVNGNIPETSAAVRGRTNLYRLVRQGNYAVLMLIKNTNWNPVEGNTYKLVLEQFTDTVVSAQVLSFTRSGGELLLRLAVMGDVNDVLYMRTCQARLGEYVDCLVVPEKSLYIKNESTGVILMSPDGQVFVPVKVMKRDGGKAYITATQTGTLTVGQSVRVF